MSESNFIKISSFNIFLLNKKRKLRHGLVKKWQRTCQWIRGYSTLWCILVSLCNGKGPVININIIYNNNIKDINDSIDNKNNSFNNRNY